MAESLYPCPPKPLKIALMKPMPTYAITNSRPMILNKHAPLHTLFILWARKRMSTYEI